MGGYVVIRGKGKAYRAGLVISLQAIDAAHTAHDQKAMEPWRHESALVDDLYRLKLIANEGKGPKVTELGHKVLDGTCSIDEVWKKAQNGYIFS